MPEKNYSSLVCLSGGVDSTAALLRCGRQFTGVRAVYVDTAGKKAPEQARESCEKLGIELIVADAQDLFNREIKDFARRVYRQGKTPNPCALCNAKVKLAVPFSMLQANEFLVTGHYAKYSGGVLRRGRDPSKDQSYFLSLVPKKILDHCCFPLAESMKADVREEVLENGLSFITGESQDLCFDWNRTGISGDIVNTDGETVGRHNGLDGYTPGQRKGLGAHCARKFVIELDPQNNRLIIGDEENLYSEYCILNNINWLRKPGGSRFSCKIQIRYRKAATPADVILHEDGQSARVRFHHPQKAVAPGQVGAMFQADNVLGGGIIDRYEGDRNA
ncbi:MAG: hypothetical protein K8S62_01440 [Candidatus Sabulitectum sp.]|nr:hypothetical protein [Candidatus Sabulitectum sp.]